MPAHDTVGEERDLREASHVRTSRGRLRFSPWILVGLYMLLVAFVAAAGVAPIVALVDGSQFGARDFISWTLNWPFVGLLAFTFVSQAVLIFGTGRFQRCRPATRRRLIGPVVVAAAMMTILILGLIPVILELIDPTYGFRGVWWSPAVFGAVLGTNWVAWTLVFLFVTRRGAGDAVARRLISILLAGSFLEILLSIASHLFVDRSPPKFVVRQTLYGVAAGSYVMLWAFGPGVLLLLMRGTHLLTPWARRVRPISIASVKTDAAVDSLTASGDLA